MTEKQNLLKMTDVKNRIVEIDESHSENREVFGLTWRVQHAGRANEEEIFTKPQKEKVKIEPRRLSDFMRAKGWRG